MPESTLIEAVNLALAWAIQDDPNVIVPSAWHGGARNLRHVRNSQQRDPDRCLRVLFDGRSIGSNDLTQLTLGVDRDSEIVAFDFDKRNPGMVEMRWAPSRERAAICGEAPADYPETARFLVEIGVDSISVNPASLMRTIAILSEAEAGL
jgi:hypothetical protein